MKTQHFPDLTVEIEHLIQAHLAAFKKATQEAVERAFAASGLPSAAPSAVPQPKRGTTRQSGRRSRAEIQQVSEQFYQAVLVHPGETMTFLAAKLGVKAQELHRPMDLLRRARKIRSVGKRHFTRYFPTADEELAAA